MSARVHAAPHVAIHYHLHVSVLARLRHLCAVAGESHVPFQHAEGLQEPFQLFGANHRSLRQLGVRASRRGGEDDHGRHGRHPGRPFALVSRHVAAQLCRAHRVRHPIRVLVQEAEEDQSAAAAEESRCYAVRAKRRESIVKRKSSQSVNTMNM